MLPDSLAHVDESPRTRMVLVVDDEPHIRELIRVVLVAGGFEVVGAGNADEAVAFYRANPGRVDLVLSDVQMPGCTGPELAVELRAISPEVRILLMSGFTGTQPPPPSLPKDIQVLEKPFKLDRLLAAVRAAIET